MATELKYRGRILTQNEIGFIRALIADNPGLSRRALSSRLCEAWNWRQSNGALSDMVCRGLMLQLHREGYIELPPVRWINPNPLALCSPERKRPAAVLVDQAPLQCA